jgi:hypothetical protein
MATQLPYRQILLRLYRNILLVHRKKLPSQMRKLGDEFVRTEFKSMKQEQKEEHVKS